MVCNGAALIAAALMLGSAQAFLAAAPALRRCPVHAGASRAGPVARHARPGALAAGADDRCGPAPVSRGREGRERKARACV